jgi:hypothetical protein
LSKIAENCNNNIGSWSHCPQVRQIIKKEEAEVTSEEEIPEEIKPGAYPTKSYKY